MGLFDGTALERPIRCEECGNLQDECTCQPAPKQWLAPAKQTARVAVEKRAKGKAVTVVRGLSSTDSDLPQLLGKLKAACGAGGTLKDDVLEVQGRHLDQVRQQLKDLGYRVRS